MLEINGRLNHFFSDLYIFRQKKYKLYCSLITISPFVKAEKNLIWKVICRLQAFTFNMTFLPLAVFGLNHIPTLGLGHTTYSLCLTHTDTWSETSTCPLRFHSRVVPLLIIKCSGLYIFWKQVLGQIHVLQIFFFPPIGWLFTFLTVFYKEQTFLILISPNYCVVVVFFSG